MIALKAPEVIDVDRICRALKHGNGDTLAKVLDNINNGSYVLLRANKSTLTVMLEPNGVHINQMTGSMKDFQEILECMMELAKQYNKRYITLEGRKGWLRMLKPLGVVARGKRVVLDTEV